MYKFVFSFLCEIPNKDLFNSYEIAKLEHWLSLMGRPIWALDTTPGLENHVWVAQVQAYKNFGFWLAHLSAIIFIQI